MSLNEETIDFSTFPEINVKLIDASRRVSRRPITNLDSAVNFVTDLMTNNPVEEVIAIMMDIHYRPLCYMRIGLGTERSTNFSVLQIIRCAVLANASGVILVHNHLTVSSPAPSAKDLSTATEIYRVLDSLRINLFDIVIMNQDGEICSFQKDRIGPYGRPADPKSNPNTTSGGNESGIPRIKMQINVTGAEIV